MQNFPRFVGWDKQYFPSTRQLKNKAFIQVNLSSKDIYAFCRKAIETAESSTKEWDLE
ncbi:hypothetical protein [Umezakia ovalisporum]|jgi:hypothetical protein|uniref:Uncharacterized protein n=2 Tax=Umezakia ovalisporum TaxID=75695 RepID=A0AA43GWZ7_9CYAN|nr:hypothetical protein [Umezakia ovalisporum]MDH6056591.1 hypothetical protein [Umezakia ovalisporum FSS-43]MDH6063289.1 hypothetical protein [Umezakia ovalisporum FSS-62]MDH6066216.1 hypothetical protein [Umezakia ovalisporum APH033B]MDH6070466.1 hypothetical protein [Umezakia ovalisporum CobakiLakeA]MDH6073065.1 hypothetical protein [Umezakia ovalisporum CS-1034]